MAMATRTTPVLVDPDRSQNLVDMLNQDDELTAKLHSQGRGETLSPAAVSLIIAGLQLAGTVGSWFVNRNQQDRQNDYQRELIDSQNEYNSPAAQLNRLLAAGVPYNTAMSMLGGTVGAATQPMSGQAASYTPVQSPSMGDIASMVAAGDQHDIAQSQVRLNDAQAYSLDPDNPVNVAQRVLHENQALLAGSQAERERALMALDDAQRQQALQNIKYLRVLGAKAKWEGILAMKDAKKRDEWLTAQIDSLAAKAGVDRATASRVLLELAVSQKYHEAMLEVNSEGRTGYQEQVYSQFLADLSQRLQNDKDTFFNEPIYAWKRGDLDSLVGWLDAVYYLTYLNGGHSVPGQKVNKLVRHVYNLFGRGAIRSFSFPE